MKYLITITLALFLIGNGFGAEVVNEKKDMTTYDNNKFENQLTSFSTDVPSIPKYFQVKQNYPNPFNATTVIEFDLSERSNTSIKVYNAVGQLVTILAKGIKEAGHYSVEWDGKNSSRDVVSSGVYFYVAVADNFYSIKKMVLLK